MLTIKILGPGCANCRKLEAVAREAVAAVNLQADIVKVTDMKDILNCTRRAWWSTSRSSAAPASRQWTKCGAGCSRRPERRLAEP
jgi:Thioredoxin domain